MDLWGAEDAGDLNLAKLRGRAVREIKGQLKLFLGK